MFEQERLEGRRGQAHHEPGSHHGGERHRGRHGGFDGPMGHHDRGFRGGGRERQFDNGELRFVILQLIAEKPSYGYELIKAIEERLSGAYAPSPGVVYPTLTMLEEEGYATVSSTEGNKKLYAATDRGSEYLKGSRQSLWPGPVSADHAGDHEPSVCPEDPHRAEQSVSGAGSQNSGGDRCSGAGHRRSLKG
jgi:DNA-binding PadR family transcriptional regulator